MVKTFLVFSATLLLLSVPVIAVVAQIGSAPPAAKAKDTAGTISKVDAVMSTLTIIRQPDSQEQIFKLDAATKITLDGKPSTVANLKAGQKVTVNAELDKALSVSATSAPANY